MTAVGYVRVSTEDHVKEGLGLDNQKSKIKAYCELAKTVASFTLVPPGVACKFFVQVSPSLEYENTVTLVVDSA